MSSKDLTLDLAKEYISPAIFLLKKYVKEKNNILNCIQSTASNPLSQEKAETQALISKFDMAVKQFESIIKPLDNKIIDRLRFIVNEQKRLNQEHQQQQPPQLTPLSYSTSPVAAVTVMPKKAPTLPNTPLIIPQINGRSTCHSSNNNSNHNVSPQRKSNEICPLTCPICCRCDFTSRTSLTRHMQDEHPKDCEVYDKIASLTPEFMLASDAAVGGNRQCWYCNAPFRSNAPLFRHIQEKHVEYFDIFIKISLSRGDNMQSVKASALNLSNRANPPAFPVPSNEQQRQQVIKPSTSEYIVNSIIHDLHNSVYLIASLSLS